MKKYFLTLCVGFLLVSCIQNSDNSGNGNYNPPVLPDNLATLTTKFISVVPESWEQYNGAEKYAYATIELDEITKTVLDYGAVMCYFSENIDDKVRDNPLPYVFPYDNTTMHNYRFDLEEGFITFILESSDGAIYLPNNTIEFKVSIFCPY